jgi:alkylated DNA repair dioxygenase AlkB
MGGMALIQHRLLQHFQPCSAYLMRGSARWDWQHSIPPVDKLRYSITFRTLRDSKT